MNPLVLIGGALAALFLLKKRDTDYMYPSIPMIAPPYPYPQTGGIDPPSTVNLTPGYGNWLPGLDPVVNAAPLTMSAQNVDLIPVTPYTVAPVVYPTAPVAIEAWGTEPPVAMPALLPQTVVSVDQYQNQYGPDGYLINPNVVMTRADAIAIGVGWSSSTQYAPGSPGWIDQYGNVTGG